MSRTPGFRGALWIAFLGSALQTGCIHNHYYGTTPGMPGCPPIGSTVTTQVGSICDMPSGQVVVTNPGTRVISSNVDAPATRTASLDPSYGPSRVVISQPAYGPPSIGQGTSRFKWKSPEPDSLPTMKAEGALDNPILR